MAQFSYLKWGKLPEWMIVSIRYQPCSCWSGGIHGLSRWRDAEIEARNVRMLANHLDSSWGSGSSGHSMMEYDTPAASCALEEVANGRLAPPMWEEISCLTFSLLDLEVEEIGTP